MDNELKNSQNSKRGIGIEENKCGKEEAEEEKWGTKDKTRGMNLCISFYVPISIYNSL